MKCKHNIGLTINDAINPCVNPPETPIIALMRLLSSCPVQKRDRDGCGCGCGGCGGSGGVVGGDDG